MNVRVGVFPEPEEIVVGGFCFGGVDLQGVSSGEAEMSERAVRVIQSDAAMVVSARREVYPAAAAALERTGALCEFETVSSRDTISFKMSSSVRVISQPGK